MEGQQHSSSKVIKVNSPRTWDSCLNQAKSNGTPVVVHFTASWCVPSLAMNPFFDDLAASHPDALFPTVDVDDFKATSPALSEVASKLDVKAMPTFVLMKDGAQVDKLVGANPEEIKKRIDGFVQSIRVYMA